MLRRALITAGLSLVLSSAAPLSAAWAAPAPAWTVDKAASKVGFTSSFGGDGFSGSFRRWDAQIAFDPKNLAGSKVVATIETGSAVTGNADRDAGLPSEGWFASAKFPRATFTATQFKDLGGGRYQAIGALTLKGVTKPLTVPFSLAITGDTAKMTSTVAVNRLSFGVGQGEWANTEVIPNPVTVTITLTAKRSR